MRGSSAFIMRIHVLARLLLAAVITGVLLTACGSHGSVLVSPTPAATIAPTATVPPTSSPAVLLAVSADANPAIASSVKQVLTELAAGAGLNLQIADRVTQASLATSPRVVVGVGGQAIAADLPTAHPRSQYIAVGVPGLQPAPNLSLVGQDGPIPDQLGFLAGYLAALITPDYRVAVLAVQDTASDAAASNGFLSGATFYCGLCRPLLPPFKAYPMALPQGTDWTEFRAAGIRTVYVVGADSAALEALAGQGADIIGDAPPPASVAAHWIATVFPDPGPALRALWPSVIKGQGGTTANFVPALTDIRTGAISPGRMRLVDQTIAALADGHIDTAVDPVTGQPR